MTETSFIAFDTETYPIVDNGKASRQIVPRMVCLSFADASEEGLVDRSEGARLFVKWVREGRTLVGLNLAYDLAVAYRAAVEEGLDEDGSLLRAVFDCPKWDIGVDAKLLDIAIGGMFLRGRYNLASLVKRFLGKEVTGKSGPDAWRLRYNELDGIPIAEWPEAASEYALNDAIVTWETFEALLQVHNPNRAGTPIQSQFDFNFHLMSSWGLMVDEEWVAGLQDFYQKQLDDARVILEEAEIIVDGTKKRKAIQELVQSAWDSIGEPPIRTPSGGVQADAKVLKELESKGVVEPLFKTYSLFNRAEKFMSTYLQPLSDSMGGPLCPRYNVIVNTGRSSASGPNVQNFPSRASEKDISRLEDWKDEGYEPDEGEEMDMVRVLSGYVQGPDIRGSFIPRPGCVFVGADYSALELATFAQLYANLNGGQVGTMGEAINRGMDPHTYMASQMLDVPYAELLAMVAAKDPTAKEARQVSKAANFGFPGGLAARSFVDFAKAYGLEISLYQAESVKARWMDTWTEVRPHFLHVARCESASGNFHVQQHGPNRRTSGWRLRVTPSYTAACNSLFQGLAADGAKYACHNVLEACYLKPESPLYGSRLLLFVHDELVIESPKERAEEAAQELSRIMVESMRVFTPDILIVAEPEIMETRWRK